MDFGWKLQISLFQSVRFRCFQAGQSHPTIRSTTIAQPSRRSYLAIGEELTFKWSPTDGGSNSQPANAIVI